MDPIVYWEQSVYHGHATLIRHLRRDRHGRVYYTNLSATRYCVVRSGDGWEVSHSYTGEDGHE